MGMSIYERKIMKLRREKALLTNNQNKQILGIYQKSIKDIADQVAKEGRGTLKSSYQRQLRQELIAVEKRMAKEIAGSINGGIRGVTDQARQLEEIVTDEMLNKIDLTISDDALSLLSQIQEGVIGDIIGEDLYGDGKTLSQRIWNTTNGLGKNIDHIVAEGMAQKKSAKELAGDLMQFAKPATKRDGKWIDDYSGLRTTDPAYNAMRLARTTINHAYQTATTRNAASNPFVDGILWQTSGHSNVCGICQDREGVIFKIEDLPMDHPNGMCTMVPSISKSMEEIGSELNAWANGEENEALDKWYNGIAGDEIKVTPSNDQNKAKKKDPAANDPAKVDPAVEAPRYKSTKEAFNSVSWRNIDKDYAKEMDAELLRVINKYPIDSKGITVKALKNERAFGMRTFGMKVDKKTGTLAMTDELMYSNALQKNKETSLKYHLSNYKGRGSALANSKRVDLATISHEYGHALDTYYVFAREPELKKTIDQLVGQRISWDTRDQVNQATQGVWKNKNTLSNVLYEKLQKETGLNSRDFSNKIRDELGTYAATAKEEFLAEGFANIVCLEDNQKSDFIKQFERLFNKEFDDHLR